MSLDGKLTTRSRAFKPVTDDADGPSELDGKVISNVPNLMQKKAFHLPLINQTSGSFQKLTKSIKSPSGTLGQLRSGQYNQAIVDTDRLYGVNPKYRDNSTNSSMSKSSQDKMEAENQTRIKKMLHFEKNNNKMKKELINSTHSNATFLEKTKFTLNIFHNSRRDQAALTNLIEK